METLWFCLVAFSLAMYVVLDGFDLGAGMVHLFVARDDAERATVIRTIGPVWDGNEVWLLASGGTIFAVFPGLYATAFSGFYLPLMMVLWLLAGRAISLEFRHQIDSPLWKPAWDVIFALSSGALALFFGVALGNVARGVPIGPDGSFFAPLWTDFSPARATGILDPYTILAGITATVALAHHGALWVAMKTEGALQKRSLDAARVSGWATLVASIAVTLWTRGIQPHTAARFSEHPWGYLFPLLAGAGLSAAIALGKKGLAPFLGSSVFLAGMLASVAFSVFPYVLPSSLDASWSLTAQAAAADGRALRVALAWWLPGMALASGYAALIYWKFRGRVSSTGEGY
jgi:cytochrome d ubiquinol oxidase subunit II